ncbi:MAG TPA: HPr family phosphocarrier protein [Clostridia bacterium]|nr:HPr family phosphocarrier protein [Clostridia bacterium]
MLSTTSRTAPSGKDVRTIRQTFTVNVPDGLHARPCALLVKTLNPFHSNVEVEVNGSQASGHSIISLMTLAANYGSKITFTIVGNDAEQAMAAVRKLFEARFASPRTCLTPKAKFPPIYASDD